MKISQLKLNDNNPRIIKDEKFKKLVKSIKDFPAMLELRPIVVDKDMMILGGNMRYRALQEAGYTDLPDTWVKIADKLTEEEKKRFIIEDNMPFGEWDWDMLANQFEIGDLLEWGFSENELKIEKEVIEDEVPQVSSEPAISKLGEVYQLGRHRLMCGDSTKIENVEKLMDGRLKGVTIGGKI
jgi:ParB-like chromosome segregation protein Spo0J